MKFKVMMCAAIATICMSCTGNKPQQVGTGIDSTWLDKTAAPGEDFFAYSCGGWMKNNPIPDEFSRFGVTQVLNEQNNEWIKVIIEELSQSKHEKGSIEQKIGDLYALMMDSVRMNKEGIQPIQDKLQQIDDAKSVDELKTLYTQFSVVGEAGLFGFYIDADEKDSKNNLLSMHTVGLSLRTKDYYLSKDENMQKIRDAFKVHVQKMFQLAGTEEGAAKTIAENVLNFETSIATATRSMIEMRDPEKNYNKMTYDEFKHKFPGMDWDNYFKTHFVSDLKQLNVGQPETLTKALEMMKSPLLKDWMKWVIISSNAAFMGDSFYAEDFDFNQRILSGKQVAPARWKRAVNSVNRTLGMAVGQMYVKKHFPEENKKRMVELVENLKVALGERIQASTWMSDSTKQKAMDKLGTFIVKVGYPDKWKSYDGMEIDPAKSIIANREQIDMWELKDMVERKLNRPVDNSEWGMTPQTVNAYYNPTTNEICFPAGILMPPFFDMNADDAYNYGGIGATIGHEMTHGFDDQGRLYDKDGNMHDWWGETDSQEFVKRSQALVEYFDNIEILPGLKAKGSQTLGENLADYGGLKVAWTAYKNATKDKPLPDADGFTADQRFFISYGFTWAENIRDEQLRLQTENDVHSVAKWRVNGILPHIDEWYQAFGITEKDPLFLPKEKRVSVW